MDISKPLKSSENFNSFENSRDSVSSSGSEDFILSIGSHGYFLNNGSSANCFCDQCSGRRIPLYTCKGESCRTNQKYYYSRKSRINSESSISFEKSLINESSDSVVDKDLPEIWSNACSEALENFP
ncbi:13925_t:CDS:2 [Dentiscutata heterogama]|uniref:13925_t:CDS:1 n=1 Tax=Dentiscutata heterogama TaxID=1316150 RepID=A0ACA9NNB9_9GLOM|nr:13925_t:CDS:2 [Dentiscutata heterogama]